MTDRERELSAMLEKYQAIGNYDRLRELAEADKERRCVILPFLPEETVYDASEFFDGTDHPEIYKLKDGWWSVGLDADGVSFELLYEGIKINPRDIGQTIFLSLPEVKMALEKDGKHE